MTNKILDIYDWHLACEQVNGKYNEFRGECIIETGDTITTIEVFDDVDIDNPIHNTIRNIVSIKREIQKKDGGIDKINLEIPLVNTVKLEKSSDGAIIHFMRDDASSMGIDFHDKEDITHVTIKK